MANPKKNILLIEDNKADVRFIEELLKKSPDLLFDLESYSRLSEGLNCLETKEFDLILLDLTLPDSDKLSTLESFIDITSKIPIIVLTGFDDKEIALNSLKKGFQDYLVKGEINQAILTRAILYAIERHKIKPKIIQEKPQIAIDEKDKMILNILQENYKISYKEISNKVGLAASTIHNRVQSMLSEGIIQEFDTFVDPLKVGYNTIAILGLSIDILKLNEVSKKLAEYNEIQLIASSAGEYNIILQVIAQNEKELWRFINEKLKPINGIRPDMNVSSFIDIYKMTHKIKFKIEQ
jgi:DNA-binding Lrp family transcriptional regulator